MWNTVKHCYMKHYYSEFFYNENFNSPWCFALIVFKSSDTHMTIVSETMRHFWSIVVFLPSFVLKFVVSWITSRIWLYPQSGKIWISLVQADLPWRSRSFSSVSTWTCLGLSPLQMSSRSRWERTSCWSRKSWIHPTDSSSLRRM